MVSGRPLTREDRERIWRAAARGVRNLTMLANLFELESRTVREAIYDGIDELVTRIDADDKRSEIEDMRQRE